MIQSSAVRGLRRAARSSRDPGLRPPRPRPCLFPEGPSCRPGSRFADESVPQTQTPAPPRLPRRRKAATPRRVNDDVCGDYSRGNDPRGDDPGGNHTGVRALHMSLEDSIKWLGEVMAEIGPPHSQKNEEWSFFNIKQANAIIDYLKISLFQHYKLYEFLFYSTREEIVIGTEQMIEVVKPSGGLLPDPLEEGISFDIYSTFIEPPPTLDAEVKGLDQEQVPEEFQSEANISDADPLVGFTIEDIKSVLGQVTDDILIGIQTEINEKLQIQEEAFNARIEKLKKA
ncbi:ciliary-associated calcium-binding coiled-coil protein 1 isoform X2 [Prionailurus viverrinus]|uniref:ciliary-associated calcium-binding coiled-coil protein 1 isoform X2 n=1 Tax=Prionailurus viverrinus TaxID=61388 RepID=UPI001FF45765|nr:ciliary-associated calcium-binding coiled-coil protein 1 isoform X2 [Prionailurus viverrinus]